MANEEIKNMVKILGLQYNKKYEDIVDLRSLRYGHLMIMTDQDQDGSHIKGLVINFIHHNWPKLIRLNFVEEFITPIVKVPLLFEPCPLLLQPFLGHPGVAMVFGDRHRMSLVRVTVYAALTLGYCVLGYLGLFP